MSVRGMIVVKEDGEFKPFLPFVGRAPKVALSDVMRRGGFATVKFVPHKEGDDVA
ncbi:hypothetical protein SEA_PIONEER3_92 [Microbacterium phage Pioneer3]|nr:hypothetical protein SEA_PIONEER3_92 [Microbacterium phage Pioneer3]